MVLALTAAVALGCTDSPGPGPTTTTPTTSSDDLGGETVRVLGLWSGPELDSFMTVKAAWEEDTGARVDWEGTQNPRAVLDAAAQDGDLPDVAVLPNPGLMHELAAEGRLVALDAVLDRDQVSQDYASAWIELGSHDGELYALFSKVTSKATVWYSPRVFAAAGYSVPETWPDLVALADTMVADGRTPFSIVAQSGAASGWPLTDWVSWMVLTGCGPDLYDAWAAGEVPWTDPCVRQSFEAFSAVVQTPGYVRGGVAGILATTDAEGAYPLYSDPPTAAMYPMASFAQAFIAARYPDLEPGADYDWFAFPPLEPEHDGAVAIGADVVVMLEDTPAARSFLTYLTGARAQQAWVELGGFTSVNRSVPPDAYPDPVARAVAEALIEAEVSRFGAGDLMPATLQRAWWAAMLELVQDPSTLDPALESLTRVAQEARGPM